MQVDLEKHLQAEIEKDKPSADPAYWAKSSCKHCAGRGVLGKVTRKEGTNTFAYQELCVCARRNWKKWQDQWLEKYHAGKRPGSAAAGKTETSGRSVKEALTRVDRIDTQISQLRSEIYGYKQRIEALPQIKILDELKDKYVEAVRNLDSLKAEITSMETLAEDLATEAENLEKKALGYRRQVRTLLDEASSMQKKEVKAKRQGVEEVLNKKSEALQDLNRRSHQFSKKIGEAERKIERLEKRRTRILYQAGIPLETIEESSSISSETPKS